ncbi:MAG: hypothetical protein WKG00_30935 [Polyangiaceae bacterium]
MRGCNDCRPNAAAALFADALHGALAAALAVVETSRDLRISEEERHRAFEMMVLSLEEWTTLAFLRRFLDEPAPSGAADPGYRAFHDTFHPAKALEQWIRRVPGSTYEGGHLQTGLVLDALGGHGPTPRAAEEVAAFAEPVPLAAVLTSKQDLVMADGMRSFLLLRKDMHVHGLLVRSTPVAVDYLQSGQVNDVDASQVDLLWIQVVDHRRFAIYGTMRDGALVHIADVEQGSMRLRDPRDELALAVATVEAVVIEASRQAVLGVVLSLLSRASSGRGGGVIIGERPARATVLRTMRHGFSVAVDSAWLSVLNPDGVALLDSDLCLTGVGCFIQSIEGDRSAGHGTRHAAVARATAGCRNVGIAISDDGSLTVYRDGEMVVRMG